MTEKKFVILANKKIIMIDDGDNESSNYGGNINKILPIADNYKDGNYQLDGNIISNNSCDVNQGDNSMIMMLTKSFRKFNLFTCSIGE